MPRSLSSTPMPLLIATLRRGGLFFVMVALMLIIKEEFPFSNFPMYSVLPESTTCLQLTDTQDKVIPIVPVFGEAITVLKKQLTHEIKMAQEKSAIKKRDDLPPEVTKAAGAKVLRWLLTHFKCNDPQLRGQVIRLQQTTFSLKDGQVVREVETLAEDRI